MRPRSENAYLACYTPTDKVASMVLAFTAISSADEELGCDIPSDLSFALEIAVNVVSMARKSVL